MTQHDPIIIVGAGHAGGRAALALREQGYQGPLWLIGEEPHLPYERPALSKQVLLGSQQAEACHLGPATLYQEQAIQCLTGIKVAAIAPSHRQITLQNGRELAYHKLVLATGGTAHQLPVPGANLPGVQQLRTLDDARALQPRLAPGQRLVVVGGGFIGLEVAASAIQLGCHVTLLEAGSRLVARALPEALSDKLLSLHRSRGVVVHLGCQIRAFTGKERVDHVELADGSRLPCDTVVVGVGIQPNTELASAAGLATGDGIRVNQCLQSSNEHIYAVGDVCEFFHTPGGHPVRLETWRNAEEQGRYVARHLLGAEEPFTASTWFWSDQYDYGLQWVGNRVPDSQCVARALPDDGLLLFYLDAHQRLQGACGWGRGNQVARDIKLAEKLIQAAFPLSATELADAAISLKGLLKGGAS